MMKSRNPKRTLLMSVMSLLLCVAMLIGATEDGFYSSSGYGDGGYGMFAYQQDDEIAALEIRFI